MHLLAVIAGLFMIAVILLDAFETIVLPRRVQRSFRLTAWFYRNTWIPWSKFAARIRSASRREAYLGYFGPFSLILLLVLWAAGLILGFALLQFGAGEHVLFGTQPITFWGLLYHSGETFFTLGYGDITPVSVAARALSVLEAGMGFAFLGVVIGYLPVVYSAFNTREIEISLLDSRAGSPPTTTELLLRLGCCPDQEVLDNTLRNWERWCAGLLAGQISYPVLSFFRSQHSNQSWLSALTVMLDTTSLLLAGVDGVRTEQARLTFAMARHAAVDLAQVVNARYDAGRALRLPDDQRDQLRLLLTANGLRLRNDQPANVKLAKLRSLYEPYVQALAERLLFTVPLWMDTAKRKDNWQGGPWDRTIQASSLERPGPAVEDHF